jgi:tetratricopeptide (TPR) repeat protein
MENYEEYLKERDWNSAEQELTKEIEREEKAGNVKFAINATATPITFISRTLRVEGDVTKSSTSMNTCKLSELYFNRAKARCFIETKEHKENNYKDVIDDCSQAIGNAQVGFCVEQVYFIRAYAQYLSKNYAEAIPDCKRAVEIIENNAKAQTKTNDEIKNTSDSSDKLEALCKKKNEILSDDKKLARVKELLGSVYQKLGDEEQSYKNFGEALSVSISKPSQNVDDFPSSLLMDKYLESRKKLNNI